MIWKLLKVNYKKFKLSLRGQHAAFNYGRVIFSKLFVELDLVYNPAGALLPPSQSWLELEHKEVLLRDYGIYFINLFTITNLLISRFPDYVSKSGNYKVDMERLIAAYIPAAGPTQCAVTQFLSDGMDIQLRF